MEAGVSFQWGENANISINFTISCSIDRRRSNPLMTSLLSSSSLASLLLSREEVSPMS